MNGTLTKLAGGHSFKVGADYRVLGVNKTYGNRRQFHVQRPAPGSTATSPAATSRNAIADLLSVPVGRLYPDQSRSTIS